MDGKCPGRGRPLTNNGWDLKQKPWHRPSFESLLTLPITAMSPALFLYDSCDMHCIQHLSRGQIAPISSLSQRRRES